VNERPEPVTIANNPRGYPPLVGVRGTVTFRNFTEIPYFSFRPGEPHALADEALNGVTPERVFEWIKGFIHAAA
jgi:hypothetical protein